MTAFASVAVSLSIYLANKLRLEGPFAIEVASLLWIEKSVFSNTYDYLVRSRMAKVVSWGEAKSFSRERDLKLVGQHDA